MAQQKSQMAETVGDSAELGLTGFLTAAERNRDLPDTQPVLCRKHDHLRREFHADGLKIQLLCSIPHDAAQSAVEIADAGTGHQTPQRGKGFDPDPMRPGHRAGFNAAGKAVTDHKITLTRSKRLIDIFQICKIIGSVTVADDDHTAFRAFQSLPDGSTISRAGFGDNTGAMLRGNLSGPVGRTVINDKDLPIKSITREKAARIIDTLTNGSFFVKAGHQNRQIHHFIEQFSDGNSTQSKQGR